MKKKNIIPLEGLIPGGELFRDFSPKNFEQYSSSGGDLIYVFENKVFVRNLSCLCDFSEISIDEINVFLEKYELERMNSFPVFHLLKERNALFGYGKIPVMAAQTTQNLLEFEKNKKFFKKLYTNAKFFDTICSVTENRQNEAIEIANIALFLASDEAAVVNGAIVTADSGLTAF